MEGLPFQLVVCFSPVLFTGWDGVTDLLGRLISGSVLAGRGALLESLDGLWKAICLSSSTSNLLANT